MKDTSPHPMPCLVPCQMPCRLPWYLVRRWSHVTQHALLDHIREQRQSIPTAREATAQRMEADAAARGYQISRERMEDAARYAIQPVYLSCPALNAALAEGYEFLPQQAESVWIVGRPPGKGGGQYWVRLLGASYCCNCPGYQFGGECRHVEAVGELLKTLGRHLRRAGIWGEEEEATP